MIFSGRNCEMEFGWKPTLRMIVKWTVILNCDFENENLLVPCFCLISHYFTFFILWNSMKKYEIVWNSVKWTQRMQFNLLKDCLDLASVSFSCSMLHRPCSRSVFCSNSLRFRYSARPWHTSSKVPHPHVHFVQPAPISRALISVSPSQPLPDHA